MIVVAKIQLFLLPAPQQEMMDVPMQQKERDAAEQYFKDEDKGMQGWVVATWYLQPRSNHPPVMIVGRETPRLLEKSSVRHGRQYTRPMTDNSKA